MEMYNGSRDPLEHLETFRTHMTLHNFPGEVACRAFPLTLKGLVRVWFGSLELKYIDSFKELACLFLMQFMESRRMRHPVVYLLTIKKREDKSLKTYLSRFNKERMTMNDQEKKITLTMLLGGVWPGLAKLARRTPTILREFMDQFNYFIKAENPLHTLTEPRKKELVCANKKGKALAKGKACKK